MKLNVKGYFIIALVLLWMVAIVIMITDYIHHPPLDYSDPLSDRKGNLPGSIYKYGILSLLELAGGIAFIYFFNSLKRMVILLILFLLIAMVVWAYADAMYSGGVPSAHALWLTAEGILLLIFFIIKSSFFKVQKTSAF